MTVDDLLPESWTPEVLDALGLWRQGHLLPIEKGVWLAPAGIDDQVTGDSAPGTQGALRARSDDFGDTGYMAVVSQTCDIADGPGRKHPFVQACPVRDISGFRWQLIQQIKDRHVNDYVWLSQPPVDGAVWAADLRVTVPVSKGVLLTVSPVQGFADDEDELQLGHRLGGKLMRPAIHDALAGPVFAALRNCLSRSKKSQTWTWCDEVEQLRLEILEGTALMPKRVRLLVLTDTKFGASERKVLREEWKAHKHSIKAAGIEWTGASFMTLDACSVKQYRESIAIDIPTLDRGRFV